MSYILLHILIKNKCLHEFIENAYQDALKSPYKCYYLHYSHLVSAFSWEHSKEGPKFWSNIHDQYVKEWTKELLAKGYKLI